MVTRYGAPYGDMGPFYQNDVKKIESVQRRATKLISHFKDKTYEDRLRDLELPSFIYRRPKGDMFLMLKILNGLVRMNTSDLFTPASMAHKWSHSERS